MTGARLVVEVCSDSPGDAEAVYESLKAEEAQPGPGRGRVTVALNGNCVVLEITPRDINSLRALMNSFLYLVHAAYSALREAGGGGGPGRGQSSI